MRHESGARRRWALAALLVVAAAVGAGRITAAQPEPSARPTPRDPLLDALAFSSGREPIAVTSDALDFDYKTRVLTYRGAVVATQGDLRLQSDTLTVALALDGAEKVKEVIAAGNVRMSKGERWATAGRAVFDQTARTVVLSDNAVLHDGQNEVSGDRVVVYLDEERSVIEGGSGRVRAVLYPPAEGATPTP
ncbi:lipopolysaccharide transport periplasmic protein LptA [Candidatus Binatia bacterium]|nr:lipopolysaccharide transport periplasmic protein LptA [Candidatus Binatia bacterium]